MELASRIVTAAGVFAGTNIDDLIVLTVLFLSALVLKRSVVGRVAMATPVASAKDVR